ncbi:Histone-lysine N-methyltransferase SETMAR [Eumeta japonica]|uniref:Histone-lysine N-methyltransferase SETMAR n=1 Tax=Eumeta variegata TaxID=151549 RepID=A0A4C1VUR4_EUMVA|nr:Histone-lysine N-methyltransferase SETMAR [Eumeta japonica]
MFLSFYGIRTSIYTVLLCSLFFAVLGHTAVVDLGKYAARTTVSVRHRSIAASFIGMGRRRSGVQLRILRSGLGSVYCKYASANSCERILCTRVRVRGSRFGTRLDLWISKGGHVMILGSMRMTRHYITTTVNGAGVPRWAEPNKKVFEERKNDRQRRIILKHDNASCHTSAGTTKFLEGQMIELGHPPYRPDLVPNDFYLFPSVKNKVRGQRFSSREGAVDAFKMHVLEIPQSEWKKCFKNWFQRMPKCIDHHDEYFEKQ